MRRFCKRELPYLVSGAILGALTLVFPQFGLVEWVAFLPMMIGLFRLSDRCDVRLRDWFFCGFLTFFSFLFVIYHWFLRLYPLSFLGLDGAESVLIVFLGWVGLSAFQAIPGGLVFLCFGFCSREGIFRKIPFLKPILFPALWTVYEWFFTVGVTGVPWARLSLGQIRILPMLQTASLLGSYFVSFLILLVNSLLAYALYYRSRRLLCAAVSAVIFCGNLSVGLVLYRTEHQPKSTVRVAAIQPNIDSHEKWIPETLDQIESASEILTRDANFDGAELVVWAESVIPYPLNTHERSAEFVRYLSRITDTPIVVGSLMRNEKGQLENTLTWVDADGEIRPDYYAKRHLVPFGEYVPWKSVVEILIPPLAGLSAVREDIYPGKTPSVSDSEWGRVGYLICFDSIYENLVLDSVRDGAELLIVSTNDSWFSDSSAVYQHEGQSVLRAIETGRTVVRAANTGISSIIDEHGNRIDSLGPLTSGYVIGDADFHTHRTLYSVVGNLFVGLCAGFCATVTGVSVFLYAKKKRNSR